MTLDLLDSILKNRTEGRVFFPSGTQLIADLPQAIQEKVAALYAHTNADLQLLGLVVNAVVSSGCPVFALTRRKVEHWRQHDKNKKPDNADKNKKTDKKVASLGRENYRLLWSRLRVICEVIDESRGQRPGLLVLRNGAPFDGLFDWSLRDPQIQQAKAWLDGTDFDEKVPECENDEHPSSKKASKGNDDDEEESSKPAAKTKTQTSYEDLRKKYGADEPDDEESEAPMRRPVEVDAGRLKTFAELEDAPAPKKPRRPADEDDDAPF